MFEIYQTLYCRLLEWSSVLSLGEQQRLAFARVLLSKPSIALMDESTSALDEDNEVTLNQCCRSVLFLQASWQVK